MAITTTTDDVVAIAPELEGQEPRITIFIEYAKLDVAESVWRPKANLAVALLTAHMLTVLNGNGIGGETTKKKLGDMEIEFSASKSDDSLNMSSYGKEFLRLRKGLVLTPLVAGC